MYLFIYVYLEYKCVAQIFLYHLRVIHDTMATNVTMPLFS